MVPLRYGKKYTVKIKGSYNVVANIMSRIKMIIPTAAATAITVIGLI